MAYHHSRTKTAVASVSVMAYGRPGIWLQTLPALPHHPQTQIERALAVTHDDVFQAGQRFERKLDRQRCDGSHQTLGNGVVERL